MKGLISPSLSLISYSQKMDSADRGIQSWTLLGLLLAFFNLLVAYSLLCISACMFFPLKILSFLYLHLPCPCSGFLGSQNTDFCWHKLFLDFPLRIIDDVIKLGVSKFPFTLLSPQNHPASHDSNLSDHTKQIPRCSSVDTGHRRRRRITIQKKKNPPKLVNLSPSSAGAISTTIDHSNSIEDIIELEERAPCDEAESPTGFIDRCQMLENALLEEKAALAAVYLELEKERAAAASAADEAMGMMLRLHEEKAQLLMEAKQYQRAIEEKFAYEDDEMDLLKEILIKREKENLFLQKELDGYKEMDVVSIKELVEDSTKGFCDVSEREGSVLESPMCSPSKVFVKGLCNPNDVEINRGEFMNCIFIRKNGDSDLGDYPVHDIHVVDLVNG